MIPWQGRGTRGHSSELSSIFTQESCASFYTTWFSNEVHLQCVIRVEMVEMCPHRHHLCTGEGGRGESSTEGEERPLPSRQAALSAICRSRMYFVNIITCTMQCTSSVQSFIDNRYFKSLKKPLQPSPQISE